MSILWGSKFTVSQGFPLTKLVAVNTGLARLRRLRSLCYFCFRWKTVSLVQASMQHLMHHVTVSLQQSKITLQNNCINNTSITQPTLSFYLWLKIGLKSLQLSRKLLWLEPYCSTTEVHQISSKAGSGINILYLLPGPISLFYDFCRFWSMAVNTIDKLPFLSFIINICRTLLKLKMRLILLHLALFLIFLTFLWQNGRLAFINHIPITTWNQNHTLQTTHYL